MILNRVALVVAITFITVLIVSPLSSETIELNSVLGETNQNSTWSMSHDVLI